MCNVYTVSSAKEIAKHFRSQLSAEPEKRTVGPFGYAPIIVPGRRALVAQWGMIPGYSDSRIPKLANGRPMSTNNARCERMATAPTYRGAWSAGRRCLIPAESYDEPYYPDDKKNTWWRFWRADGEPWALAGLWSEWTDHATGEVVPNFTMITQNCDAHALLKRFHKPERDKEGNILPPDKQDKRAVVPLERASWDTWLEGTIDEAKALIQLPPVEVYRHGPADPSKQVQLVI